MENYFIDDDTNDGFTTIFNKMFNALDTLKDNASDSSTRSQFISTAQNFCTYFNSVATGLSQIQDDCNQEIKSTVDNINSIAEKIALLNKQINVLEVQGGYANELRDQRALLIDELSAIVPVTVSEVPVTNSNDPDMQTGANYYTVKVNGETLVSTYDYETLTCTARENKIKIFKSYQIIICRQLTSDESKLLKIIAREKSVAVDVLSELAQMPVRACLPALLMLEIKKRIKKLAGGTYTLP